jgi:hypothetical protein
MKQLVVKNILSFLELDDRITEIASNQIKILTYLENKQDYLTNNNIDLLNPNVIEPVDSTFKNIIYYTMGTVLILGVIYYFTFGGGNGETINNIYSTIHDISQKINENNLLIDNNAQNMLDTIIRNNNHLVDVIDRLFIHNNEQINKIISIKIFNAILRNGRYLEDISKILESTNLTSNIGNVAINNLKKVSFSDE